jgi:hypothetical protein
MRRLHLNEHERSSKPFRDALRELVVASGHVTKTGDVNWHGFARGIDGLHYETLRKVLTGQRRTTPQVIEATAAALRVRPGHFVEYRLHQARTSLDETEVGFEEALRALDAVGDVRPGNVTLPHRPRTRRRRAG